DVEQRRVVYCDTDLGKVVAEHFGIGARRFDRARRCKFPQPGERLPRRESVPFGRLHPRHPPAFLIDRDQQPLAPVDRAQLVGKSPQLRPILHIAPEQDVPGRIGFTEERPLLRAEGQTGKTEDRGRHPARFAGIRQRGKRGRGRGCGQPAADPAACYRIKYPATRQLAPSRIKITVSTTSRSAKRVWNSMSWYSPAGAPGNALVGVALRRTRVTTAPNGSRTGVTAEANCSAEACDLNMAAAVRQLSFQFFASTRATHS